jgi:predicted nucleic acid-binding protein
LSFDLDATLRTLKPQRRTPCPPRRSDAELPWAQHEPFVGRPLLLDTTVYIDVLHGVSPPEVDRLLQLRTCNHSAVCLAELTHAFGRLDPEHRDTQSALQQIRRTVTKDIPAHRLQAPGNDVWGAAGIVAGWVLRLRKLPRNRGHERRLLNDALLHLQARKMGCTVLTRNIEDFDILNRLVPGGRVIFYRKAAA